MEPRVGWKPWHDRVKRGLTGQEAEDREGAEKEMSVKEMEDK